MSVIEDLLRKRWELLKEIDQEIQQGHTREVTLLFTDIVGSTSFYEKWGDIAGRQMIQTHNDLLFPIIKNHAGHIVKTMGDGLMAIFEDTSQALFCTVAMQQAITKHNSISQGNLKFRVRMGLHYGRAVIEERDLFGDVVNTAARVESLADGGEIFLSGTVVEHIKNFTLPLTSLGTETIKGREHTVDLYAVDWQHLGEDRILSTWRKRHHKKSTAGPKGNDVTANVVPSVDIKSPLNLQEELRRLPPVPTRGNPYMNRVMIRHPEIFIGRRALVRRITKRLSGSRPQSLSLVGERRIGKSSLLNHLRSPEVRLVNLKDPERCFFVFIDFQQVRALGPERLVSLMISGIRKQTGMSIAGEENYECMQYIAETLAEQNYRLVFLFDEFETVTRTKEIRPEFYSFLRSLANSYPISFVCVSGRNLKDLCVSKEISDSPFFNIFSQIRVGQLTDTEGKELITEPSSARGIPLSPVTEQILSMGGKFPFFLQMACCAWFEYLESEEVPAENYSSGEIPSEVSRVFREEAFPHFEYITEYLPKEEITVLRKAAESTLPAGSEEPAVESLNLRGYLREEENQLFPFSGEFSRFIIRSET